ncbi:MAG: hypothetical protein RLZZ403_301 [Pseudomonadota bacterium]
MAYSSAALANPVARLQERLARGDQKLEFSGNRGYLDSLLKALGIDPSSQLLVYSKSSLQKALISPARPRALYFNDSTYIGWVQDSDQLEVATVDCDKGPVFYVFSNRQGESAPLKRETTRCLTCHDTVGLLGGGIPAFTVYSMPVDGDGGVFVNDNPVAVSDATPIAQRWAGWYVTGQHGTQVHLGNRSAATERQFHEADPKAAGNRDDVTGFLDARPYLTDKSDIVALLVFEHQAAVQSHLSRALFKSREFLARETPRAAGDTPLAALSPRMQALYKRLLEPVVRSLLFVDAVPLTDSIRSSAGFPAWFEAQGPRDAKGRSLRELDLRTRLFRYPLSYVIYSEAFDGLPRSARQYVYARLQEVLSGKEADAAFAHLTDQDRRAILEILIATKPEFAEWTAS